MTLLQAAWEYHLVSRGLEGVLIAVGVVWGCRIIARAIWEARPR